MSKTFTNPATKLSTTVSGNTYSELVGLPKVDTACIVVSWENGSSLDANDYIQQSVDGIIWDNTPSCSGSLSGTSGVNMYNLNNVAFPMARVFIDHTAGTADVTVKVTSKTF